MVQNESIVNQINGCGGNIATLMSILFDEYGYFATSCETINKLYLIFANGTDSGKTMTTLNAPRYIGFDAKGHFIQILSNQITVYN